MQQTSQFKEGPEVEDDGMKAYILCTLQQMGNESYFITEILRMNETQSGLE